MWRQEPNKNKTGLQVFGHEDPRHDRYTRICFVCQAEAGTGKKFQRNYGGVVCMSCRAFWRRANAKKGKVPKDCKEKGACPITVATRLHCKKCRYERCLLAGMTPDAVLSDDQELIR